MHIYKIIIVLVLVLSLSIASPMEDIQKSMRLNYIEQMQNTQIIKLENEKLIEQNAIYYKNVVDTAIKYYKGYIGKSWEKIM